MKKILLSILILTLTNVVNAEELYLRCIPKITQVKAGDYVEGDILWHRALYVKFEKEFDLTKSNEPETVISKIKTYLIDLKGKKDKTNYDKIWYKETSNTKSFDFEDSVELKKFISFTTMNINFDGASWVGSGNISQKKIENDAVQESNISWFGKCYELTKKQFKKRIGNREFEKSVE